MKGHHTQRLFRNACMLVTATSVLAACLSDEASEDPAEIDAEIEISGSVGDGPVVGATVRILRNDGAELAQVESDSSANYNIVVRTEGKYYPLTVDSRNGTDLVTSTAPDFDLLGAVLAPGNRTVANINPFTTFTVELARDLAGGETQANLSLAQNTVATQFNSGLSTLKTSGAMTTTISASNVAEMVRASEALGETVRRTRNAVSASGFTTSGNAVVRALASDLSDEVVDGLGGQRSDARLAAVSTVVAAQVLLETMANELHVNGVDATQAMRDAINQVSSNVADPALDDLTTTPDMITRAKIGLEAAFAVTSDPLIGNLHTIVSDIQPNSSSQTIRSLVLPSDYRNRLDNAILLVAGGSTDVHEAVNAISRNGGSDNLPTDDVNTAPTISGTPATTVTAGSAYSFTPGAADVDGDTLTFAIGSAPSWANFDTASGTLSGTPTANDAGTYPNISISVSDGALATNLPSFTITVTETLPANNAPQISGSPQTVVLAGDTYTFAPSATDADGDSLTFSVTGMPGWAVFNQSTGELSGEPGSGDVGTYANIMISVSDGLESASLPAFTITVDAVALGSVTLSWTPPTQNTDGTALTDLAGYKLYWGTTAGSYPNKITIDNASVSTYVVENLVPGTYEFVATAFNSSGVESDFSGVATKTVP